MMAGDKAQSDDLDAKNDPHAGFTDLWHEFSQSTGIHAINKISTFGCFGRRSFLWTLAICCTTGFLFYNLWAEIQKYYSYPVITTIMLDERTSLEFPAITICNRCPLNRTRVKNFTGLEEYFFASSILGIVFQSKQNSVWNISNEIADQPLSRDWWRSISMEVSEMFKLCFFRAEGINCLKSFKSVFTSEGLCHTFNYNASDVRMVRTGGNDYNLILMFTIRQNEYTFRNNMASGVKVFIHDPRDDPESTSSVVFAPPGFSTYIGLQRSEFSYLPYPYTAFSHGKCVDTSDPSFVNPLKYHKHYTYYHCVTECVQKEALARCGCVGPEDPQDAPVCSILKQRCYDEFLVLAKKDAAFDSHCDCSSECSYTVYDTRTSYSGFPADIWSSILLNSTDSKDMDYMAKNLLELRVFYEQMFVTTTKQNPQYTENSIFASIGGQMGLCLGASLLTVAELVEFLVLVMLYIWDKLRGQKPVNRIKNLK